MIRFECDYLEGAPQEVINAIGKVNFEQNPGYGDDSHCARAKALIKEACAAEDSEVFFVVGGTQANLTIIGAVLKNYQGVIAPVTAHINCHEAGAIEATGHKVLTVRTADGKLLPEQIDKICRDYWNETHCTHIVQPGMVYISQTTEVGTLYSKAEVAAIYETCKKNNSIDISLYQKYDVKRGLRDLQGRGVLTGLTDISEVTSKKIENGKEIPIDGILRYRGYAIEELIKGQYGKQHFGFEEIAYLLLFGELPDEKEFKEFLRIFANFRTLPNNFVRDIIMKAPSKDLMNTLARSVLTLYVYDEEPENTQIENVLRQCLELIALFPMLSVYSYQTYKYYYENESFFIHQPRPDFSTAENILYIHDIHILTVHQLLQRIHPQGILYNLRTNITVHISRQIVA